MTDKLLELAKLWGVETQVVNCFGLLAPRPRLDIAHDLLAKLPGEWKIALYGTGHQWSVVTSDNKVTTHSIFEPAVITLAERSGK